MCVCVCILTVEIFFECDYELFVLWSIYWMSVSDLMYN